MKSDFAEKEDVYVVVNAAKGGSEYDKDVSFYFSEDPNHPNPYLDKDGTLEFPNARKHFNIIYSLIADPELKLRFHSTPRTAIWIWEGEKCPTSWGEGKGQFKGNPVVKGDVLTVNNINRKKQNYKYVLRFFSDGLKRDVNMDPVVINGGGGDIIIEFRKKAIIIVGGLILSALVFFGARKVQKSSNDDRL